MSNEPGLLPKVAAGRLADIRPYTKSADAVLH
jgi:hypothetical protein